MTHCPACGSMQSRGCLRQVGVDPLRIVDLHALADSRPAIIGWIVKA
jgi:hypothetical protein